MTHYQYYKFLTRDAKFEGHEHISETEYDDLVHQAVRDIESQKNKSSDGSTYVVYNINSIYIKFKIITTNIEVNYFTKDEYETIISQYKET